MRFVSSVSPCSHTIPSGTEVWLAPGIMSSNETSTCSGKRCAPRARVGWGVSVMERMQPGMGTRWPVSRKIEEEKNIIGTIMSVPTKNSCQNKFFVIYMYIFVNELLSVTMCSYTFFVCREILAVTNFCKSVFTHKNRKNLCLANIFLHTKNV